MPFIKTDIAGLLLFQPVVFEDNRGYFYESYNRKAFEKEEVLIDFVQDNQARSAYGTIRGLHFQRPPFAQTKLVRALSGKILDVVADLRPGSETFGKTYSAELSAENKNQLLVPKGFAHGYSVLSETAEVFYKCDEYYAKEYEGGIFFNDSDLAIDWKIEKGKEIISEKDRLLPSYKDVAALINR